MLKLKEIRKAKGKTQTEVAKAVGISQNNYSYWENGKVKIDNNSLTKLANYFNVSIDYLLGNSELMPTPTTALTIDQARDVWLASLDPDDKQSILVYLGLSLKDKMRVQGYMLSLAS